MRVLALCLVIALCLFSGPASADGLKYSHIDRVTVRVLALSTIELERVEREKRPDVELALPVGGHGSGFIVGRNGLIATAAHVVEDARALAVHLPGRKTPLPAELVAIDRKGDFALLRVGEAFDEVANLAPPEESLSMRQPSLRWGTHWMLLGATLSPIKAPSLGSSPMVISSSVSA